MGYAINWINIELESDNVSFMMNVVSRVKPVAQLVPNKTKITERGNFHVRTCKLDSIKTAIETI